MRPIKRLPIWEKVNVLLSNAKSMTSIQKEIIKNIMFKLIS